MMSRWITLWLLAGALTFAMGCPEDDDDSAGDDDAGDDDGGDDDGGDDDGGDDDGGDDDGGDDDGGDDDTSASPWAGDYLGGVSGDGHGLFDLTIDDAGAATLDGEVGSGEAMTGSGQVEEGGSTTLTVTIAVKPKSLVDCTGTMRDEGGERYGYGDWTSSDKGTGNWAVWPDDFALDIPTQDVETGCANSTKYCGAPAMTAKDCLAVSTCQGAFMAAASADCVTVYEDFMQIFLTMDGPEDCPDFQKPLPGWVKHDCPEIFSACGMLLP